MDDAIVSYAIGKFDFFLIQEVNKRIGVNDVVMWFKNNLSFLQVSLRVLETKQQMGHIRLWIDIVKDITNEVVVILERFSTNQEEHASPKQGVLDHMQSCSCSCSCICKKEKTLYDIGKDIESLKERFIDIRKRQYEYKINDILANLSQNQEPRKRIKGLIPFENEEQVILELENDEFYTLGELDELDQSMTYLARKFSNIRVKKPRYFKNKEQSFNKDNRWKEKGKYNSDSKNGYKTGSVDRSNVRCFNCDEQGHFATECRKPKKAKKDKAYLELEAKYEALLRKQQSKTYIAEGKSWDDSENDEDKEFGNYALMTLEQGESSSSKSHTPNLTIIDLNMNQYKETVKKMSTEMLHIHTSRVAANEEVSRLTKINEKLESEKEKLENNKVKMKFLRNASELAGHYHEKNKPYANFVIRLDYDSMNDKKKTVGDKGKTKKTENAPTILKEQEIADEDKEKKTEESVQSSNTEEKLMNKQSPKTPVKETKTEDAKKKRRNRNGKIGINKSNNFAYVVNAPRKKCEKCGSTNHLTHLCKKVVSKPTEGTCKYNEANSNNPYSFCDKFDCIPCNLKVMKSFHKLRVDLKEIRNKSTSEGKRAQ
ncbi:hypothetical protein AgCh_008307 [Apium graveolens]